MLKRLPPSAPAVTVPDQPAAGPGAQDAAALRRSLSASNPPHPASGLRVRSAPNTHTPSPLRNEAPRAASFSHLPGALPANAGLQAASEANVLEAGQQDDNLAQPPVSPATSRRLPPACADNGKRVANGLKRVAITSTKAYLSFIGIGAAIKLAKNPGDLRQDAMQFVKAAFTGTARADSLEVQQGRDLVLKTYGAFIDTTKQCVDPVITFVPALRKGGNGPQTSGMFVPDSSSGRAVTPPGKTGIAANATLADNSTAPLRGAVATRVQSGELRFTTYNLYLPQIAVHEYLHCFTNPNFRNALGDTRLDDQLRHNLVEGTTQYLTLQTPFNRRGDSSGKYSGIYKEELAFIGKVADDVGIETLKKAYLAGDQKAIGKMWDAATKRAEILFRR